MLDISYIRESDCIFREGLRGSFLGERWPNPGLGNSYMRIALKI